MQANRKAFLVILLMTTSAVIPGLLGPVAGESNGGGGDGLVLQHMTVFAKINGAYAVTEATATLFNPADKAQDRTFSIRVPKEALISNFSLTMDGVTFYADVIEAEEARERYNESVSAGRTAGLLASTGVSVFNYGLSIGPGQTLTASLRFEQLLLKTNGMYTYHLHLTSDGDPLPAEAYEVLIDIDAITAIDIIKTDGYDGVLQIDQPSSEVANVALERLNFVPGEDIEVRWGTGTGPVEGSMYFYEADGQGYFAHILNPSQEDLGGIMGKDFVFILDKSGSMSGKKFEQAKEAMAWLLGTLRSRDRFGVVCFDTSIQTYSGDMVDATEDNRKKGEDWVNDLETGGGTNIHIGVMAAFSLLNEGSAKVPIIVLLTDGQANAGLYHRSDFRKDVTEKNTMDAVIHCVAIGDGADWTFVRALALENNGTPIWVTEKDDITVELREFFKSFKDPIFSEMTMDYGPAVIDIFPETVRGHYLGSEVLITGTYEPGTGSFATSLSASTQGGPREITGDFKVLPDPENGFVARLYAFARIQDLLERTEYNGVDNETVDEIVHLGIKHQFVTKYTSFFVELPEEISSPELEEVWEVYPSYDSSGAMSAPHPSKAAEDSVPGMGTEVAIVSLMASAILAWMLSMNRRHRKKGA